MVNLSLRFSAVKLPHKTRKPSVEMNSILAVSRWTTFNAVLPCRRTEALRVPSSRDRHHQTNRNYRSDH